MLRIELDLADNPIGADPKVGLYKAINRKYASYELSLTNSKIIDLRSYSRVTDRRLTKVTIQHNTTFEYFDFYYSRFDLDEYISNPFWDPSDKSTLSELTNSSDLVALIGRKTGLNLNDDTHWVDRNELKLAGGSVTPNFSLRSLYNSVYFVGDQILWLHVEGDTPPPDPDPEPTDGYAKVFPIVKPTSNKIDLSLFVDKTIVIEGSIYEIEFIKLSKPFRTGEEVRIINMTDDYLSFYSNRDINFNDVVGTEYFALSPESSARLINKGGYLETTQWVIFGENVEKWSLE